MNDGHTPSGLARDAATAPGGYTTYRPRLPLGLVAAQPALHPLHAA